MSDGFFGFVFARWRSLLFHHPRDGKSKRRAIQYVDHMTGDGPALFEHVCRLGLEGVVSKRADAPYRSGPSKAWLKSKNPASEAVRREREEEWR